MKSNFFTTLFVGVLLLKVIQEGILFSWLFIFLMAIFAFLWPYFEMKILKWVFEKQLAVITWYYKRKAAMAMKKR